MTSQNFQSVQYAFTRHLRDPEHEPAPADIEDRRMAIYRRLLFNNVKNFMANSFRVLRKVTPEERWEALMRDYFKRHQATNPLFPRMPQEFVNYLEHERDDADDPSWMLELAHYEWMETAAAIDPREIDMTGINNDGDLLAGVPIVNPLVFPLTYQWPVHKISPDYLPEEVPEQPTHMVIYRNRDDKVGFSELNPVAARLLELCHNNQHTGQALLEQIAAELGHGDPASVIRGGSDIMARWRDIDILLGTRSIDS